MIKVDPAPETEPTLLSAIAEVIEHTRPTEPVPQRVADERTFDVPVRLAMVPTGA
jgi:hypothetical protein